MNRRENTFRVDYSNVPKKPSFEDVHNFIGNELGLKHGEVTRLQCSRTHGCAFVKVIDNDLAQQIVDQHDGKHVIEHEGKSYLIRIAMEDGAVDVKLFDLSDEVSDDEIIDFLSDYGEVISIRDLYWEDKFLFKAIPTGVRVVKMFVERNIDSYVTIGGLVTQVQYHGQQHTCRHCNEFAHNGISCVSNKKLMVQKTYADAAKQPKQVPKQTAKPAAKQNSKPAALPLTKPLLPTDTAQTAGPSIPIQLKNQIPPPIKFTKLPILPQKTKDNGNKTDGNDTDTSSTSGRSLRSKSKKHKGDDGVSGDAEMGL